MDGKACLVPGIEGALAEAVSLTQQLIVAVVIHFIFFLPARASGNMNLWGGSLLCFFKAVKSVGVGRSNGNTYNNATKG